MCVCVRVKSENRNEGIIIIFTVVIILEKRGDEIRVGKRTSGTYFIFRSWYTSVA